MAKLNKTIAVSIALLMFSFFLKGCGGEIETGTANPYYRQGLALRQNNEMEKAVEAFKQCLRLSPEVAEAHFQLAILYEDHLNEPVKALFHYSQFLAIAQDDPENTAVANQSIERIERQLMERWAFKYPEIIRAQANIAELESRISNLQLSRNNLIEQTRKLIAELRIKNEQLSRLQE